MDNNYLMHWRTKGSKNGQRLYQNKDGSLTPLGREHYGVGAPRVKSALSKASKWAGKKADNLGKALEKRSAAKSAKKAAKNHTIDEAKLKNMSDEDIRKEISRMNLEQEYRQTFEKLNPQKPKALKALSDAGKEIVKNSLRSAFEKKLTETLHKAMDLDNPDTIRQTQAYKEWKEHDFDPDYSPTSIKNKYSDEYLKELNRSERVKAQVSDNTYNAQNANPEFWKRINESRDRDATAPVAEAQREVKRANELVKDLSKKLKDAENGKPTQEGAAQIKTRLEEAEKSRDLVMKLFDTAMDNLTVSQKRIVNGGANPQQNNQPKQNNQNQQNNNQPKQNNQPQQQPSQQKAEDSSSKKQSDSTHLIQNGELTKLAQEAMRSQPNAKLQANAAKMAQEIIKGSEIVRKAIEAADKAEEDKKKK